MKAELEKLVEKWICEELELRRYDSKYTKAEFVRRCAKASLLAVKRRELQEAAGLVVMP